MGNPPVLSQALRATVLGNSGDEVRWGRWKLATVGLAPDQDFTVRSAVLSNDDKSFPENTGEFLAKLLLSGLKFLSRPYADSALPASNIAFATQMSIWSNSKETVDGATDFDGEFLLLILLRDATVIEPFAKLCYCLPKKSIAVAIANFFQPLSRVPCHSIHFDIR